jgi:hypothetical protein
MQPAPPLESLAQAFMNDLIQPNQLGWPAPVSAASSSSPSSAPSSSSSSSSSDSQTANPQPTNPFAASDAATDVVNAASGPALVHSMRYMLVSLQKQLQQAKQAEERAVKTAERTKSAMQRQHERELEQLREVNSDGRFVNASYFFSKCVSFRDSDFAISG